jgi:hypothetical protein
MKIHKILRFIPLIFIFISVFSANIYALFSNRENIIKTIFTDGADKGNI